MTDSKSQERNVMSDMLFYAATELNFRNVHTTGIARGILYRCSHPCVGSESGRDNIEQLANMAHIKSVINLCDNEDEIKRYAIAAPWYKKIVDADNAIALSMQFDFRTGEFTEKLKRGLQFITMAPPPFLVHCYAGFDRTGIFCAILEALMGATKKEIGDDYSLSYKSNCDSEFYEFDNQDHGHIILRQLEKLYGTKFTDKSLQNITEQILLETVGLSTNEIGLLKRILGQNR
ncbi:MAG: hypothetical protein Ta2G_05470 [Termitinemataceae bacterium]|nr:MAG: hypothetical protein Ta2G_05470 [Termitinemataceae bacterium]